MKKFLVYLSLVILDIVIVIAAALIIYILLSGNGVHFNFIRIGYHSVQNLITVLLVLAAIRLFSRRQMSFLGVKKFYLEKVPYKSWQLCETIYNWVRLSEGKKVTQIVFTVIMISTIIKLLNAWYYYGFYCGDDTEIHEMTFAKLFNWDWKAWNLRNAFYPMFFIYPIQAIMKHIGIDDPSLLVFGGRVVVVSFSAVNLLLIFKIASREFNSIPVGLFSLFFLALSKLHTAFASSELPRTVASTFVLLCFLFLVLNRRKMIFVLIAGISLGIGAAIRFSEVMFIVPVLIYLIFEKRFRHAVAVILFFAGSSLLVLGVSDILYWGSPFFSLKNIVNYTFVKKLSSAGYQPFYYYATNLNSWSNYFTIGLVLFSVRRRNWKMLSMVIIPLVILSLFFHKDKRYLVPVIPFIVMIAGATFWNLLEHVHQKWQLSQTHLKKHLLKATALVFILVGIILFELAGFRFRRSESAVDVALYLAKQSNVMGVAIQQSWAAGGRIYLWRTQNIIDISRVRLSEDGYFLRIIKKPEIQYIAMRYRDIEGHGYKKLLEKHGYVEVNYSPNVRKRKREYGLFKRETKNL